MHVHDAPRGGLDGEGARGEGDPRVRHVHLRAQGGRGGIIRAGGDGQGGGRPRRQQRGGPSRRDHPRRRGWLPRVGRRRRKGGAHAARVTRVVGAPADTAATAAAIGLGVQRRAGGGGVTPHGGLPRPPWRRHHRPSPTCRATQWQVAAGRRPRHSRRKAPRLGRRRVAARRRQRASHPRPPPTCTPVSPVHVDQLPWRGGALAGSR